MNANVIAVQNKDIERASFIVAKSKAEVNPILLGAKVAMIAELKKRMGRGEIVEFDFVKKSNGEIRHAIGCLYGNLIDHKIKGTGVHNSIYGNCTYYDLEKQQFRCFSYETLIKVY